ncbi:MAG: hypothetical protein ABIP71_00980, partial [Verrucomicrobiota bacterium]
MRCKNFLPAIFLAFCSCAHLIADKTTALSRYEFSQPEMGVPFRMVMYAATEAVAQSAAKAAFD